MRVEAGTGTYKGQANDHADERVERIRCRDEAERQAEGYDGEYKVEGTQHQLGDGERLAGLEWLGFWQLHGLELLRSGLVVDGFVRRAEACGSRLLGAAGLRAC